MLSRMEFYWYRFRYLFGGLLFILLLPLLSLLPPASNHAPFAQSQIQASASQTYADTPNAVTAGLAEGLSQVTSTAASIGKSTVNLTYKMGLGVYNALHHIGETSVLIGKNIGIAIGKGFAFAAHTMASALAFFVNTVAGLFGNVTRIPLVNSYVSPAKSVKAATITPVSFAVADMITLTDAPETEISTEAQAITWPIHGNVTTLFGVPHWPFQPTHTGMDISSGKRSGATPIVPYKAGRVIQTVRSNSGLGNHVIVDHGEGITSVYAHLYSITAKIGQEVNTTDILGYEGSTGTSTGTHLHFEIRVNNQPVNPQTYFDSRP